MAERPEIAPLIERLERASEGSRGLDGLIAVALGWVFTGLADQRHIEHWPKIAGHWYTPEQRALSLSERLRLVSEDTRNEPPEFTTSLDAALTLVPEGHRWLLDARPYHASGRPGGYRAQVYRQAHPYASVDDMPTAWATTPALALATAALRARAEAAPR